MKMDFEKELEKLSADDAETGVIDSALAEGRERLRRRLRKIARPRAGVGEIDTPVGRLFIAQSDRGLVTVRFLRGDDLEREVRMLRAKFDLVEDRAGTEAVGSEIKRYVQGDSNALGRRVDLSLVEGDFQRRTLSALGRIPRGSVTTYRALAEAVGAPQAQRAVGNTMATNPIPFYLPCHRVIRSDGSIGNYGGGVGLKVTLLKSEGFNLIEGPKLSSEVVLGHRTTRIFCRPVCSAARRAAPGKMLIFADAAHAQATGLRPCRLCRPL